MPELKNKTIAPLFLFASAVLWSMSGIFTKSVTWNGVCLAILRGVIAVVVAGILLRRQKIRLNRTKVLAAICYFVQGVLFMCANKYTTAANATVLQNTSPLYIILFSALLAHKRPTRRECLTCSCLFIGVALAFAGNLSSGGMLGNMMALISALFYAGIFFLSKEDGAAGIPVLGQYLLSCSCALLRHKQDCTSHVSQSVGVLAGVRRPNRHRYLALLCRGHQAHLGPTGQLHHHGRAGDGPCLDVCIPARNHLSPIRDRLCSSHCDTAALQYFLSQKCCMSHQRDGLTHRF